MAMFHKSRQNYDRLFGCSATCCVGMSLSPKSKVRSGCLREVTLSDALPTAAEAPLLCRHQRALGEVVLLHLHFFPVSLIY